MKERFKIGRIGRIGQVGRMGLIRRMGGMGLMALAALAVLAVVGSVTHGLTLVCLAVAPLALTEEQLKEFTGILDEVKGGWERVKALPDLLKKVEDENASLRLEMGKLQKRLLNGVTSTGVRYLNGTPFVSDECAKALASLYVIAGAQQNKLEHAVRDASTRDSLIGRAAEFLGLETRAALTATDIPLPTIYIPQVVELIWKYGQFRQNATVFPLGAGTVKLPQLKAGEDAFGLIALSAPVSERKVAAQNVTFTASKVGGIIRIPTEIEEDTFIPLGQFLARYISRRFAIFEDTFGFLGDGSANYNNEYGVGPNCTLNGNTYCTQLGAGKTKPSDSTITDWRNIRAQVNAAALANAAYYCHPTMEVLLVSFNTIGQPLVYHPAHGAQLATLDGYPIRWCGIMQSYKTTAAPSAFLALFGDLSYWYLGERLQPP